MIHPLSPDLEQAVHLFFADLFVAGQSARPHRIGMAEIKKEFRKKAMRFHPDRAALLGENKGLLEEKFKEISDAYGVLKTALTDDHIIIRPPPAASAQQAPRPDFSEPVDPPFRRPAPPHAPKTARAHSAPRHHPFSENAGPFQRRQPSFFHKGMMPHRKLRFGEFLFYKQIIAWHTLIQAIVWQHRVRPRIGRIALDLNYLEPRDIATLLRNRKYREPFCRAAVRLGFLDNYQRIVLLGRQRNYNLPLGKFFLDARILGEEALEHYVHENRIHNFYADTGLGGSSSQRPSD